MKNNLIFSCVLLISLNAFGQIPNAGFETWISAGSFEDAQDWTSYNQYTQFASITTVSKTTDAHSGTYAALAETKSFFNTITGIQDTVPGIMVTGTDILSSGNGFPFALRPDSLSAWYKYSPAGSDFAGIGVILSKWNSSNGSRDYIASGEISIFSAAASYTYGSAPLTYFMPDVPDTAFVYLSSSNGSIFFPGSVLTVDDISFVTPVGTEEISGMNSFNVTAYPNPASGNINIKLLSPGAVIISIYDITGRIIYSADSHGNSSVNIDLNYWNSGFYSYIISTKDGSKKAKGKFCVLK
jgi:hypothetical protein